MNIFDVVIGLLLLNVDCFSFFPSFKRTCSRSEAPLLRRFDSIGSTVEKDWLYTTIEDAENNEDKVSEETLNELFMQEIAKLTLSNEQHTSIGDIDDHRDNPDIFPTAAKLSKQIRKSGSILKENPTLLRPGLPLEISHKKTLAFGHMIDRKGGIFQLHMHLQ